VVELPNGRLIGLIRFQFMGEDDPARGRQLDFSMFQTASDDGGATWTPAQPTGVYGSPPHLLRHSSGRIVCVYGYRQAPFGQRAMIREDGGKTWTLLARKGPQHFGGYLHPRKPGWIYMTLCEGAPGAGLWLSRDGGKTWTAFDRLPFRNIQRVEFDPTDDSVIYVTTFGGSVWRGPTEPAGR
jgi:photosystem II stability/assembly factor-like uncharacterized protein